MIDAASGSAACDESSPLTVRAREIDEGDHSYSLASSLTKSSGIPVSKVICLRLNG